jgi:inner membrane transporter RhtA
VPPPALVVTGIVSVQLGAGLAGRTFTEVTPAVMTGLRLWSAAALMAAFGARGMARSVRGLARDRAWRDSAVVLAFGVILGIMNFSIYQAFARIPLGIAVTLEFLGPLAVAVLSSRRVSDLAWVGLAGCGVALLSNGWGSLSAHGSRAARGPVLAGPVVTGPMVTGPMVTGPVVTGTVFALVAAACWAAYILLSRSTGRRFGGSSGLVIAMVIAAVTVTPPAAVDAARAASSLTLGVVGTGIAVGLLSSVIPYRLELEALRMIPARIFGIWMSLEPAVAALAGLVLLHEALAPREWAAIGCVVIASAGAARQADLAQLPGGAGDSREEMHMTEVALRPVEDADLDALFDQMRDPEAVRMAAFTPPDPDDRPAFDAHMARVRSSPDVTMRAVTCDGQLVGSVASFVFEGQTEVTYWIDRPAWGRGIASRALELLLKLVPDRPLHARAASDNLGSLRVLQKAGFTIIGTENSYAPGRKRDIEETILRLG